MLTKFTSTFVLLLLVTGLNLCTSLQVQAQKTVINGQVIDDHTEEPIPFTNIFVKGTTIGTVTDIDGNYRLEIASDKLGQTSNGIDSLGVSAIGYSNIFKVIQKDAPEQTIKFRLLRADVLMEEFVVEAGENPADVLIREIIKHKKDHNINQLPAYSYETYNKLELDLANVKKDMLSKNKLLRPFDFIFENIDSVSEERPFLPMFLTETLSDYYHQEDPKINKEVIKASKISGVENESVTQFLGNMYQKIDIYDNFMPLMGKNIPSPVSNQAFAYYKYMLVDSATIDGRWSYHITFKPKQAQINVFTGDLWVIDSIFAIKRVGMELVGKEVNVNLMNKLSVFQEFAPVANGEAWAMKKDKLIIDFVTRPKDPSIIGRKSTYFKDFNFDAATISNALSSKEDVEISKDVFEKDENFWQQARHDSLSANEKSIYAMVDSLEKMPLARTYADIINTIVTGYKTFGKIEFGPYFSLISSNVVEGLRLRLGMRTSNRFSERVKLGAYGAYGFKDKRFKYGGDVLWILSRKPRQALSGKFQSDLDIASETVEEFGQDNIFAGLYRRNLPQKLMHMRTAQITYARDWRLGWSNKLTVKHRRLDPYFDFYYFDETPLDTPRDSITSATEISINTRFAYQEKFLSGEFFRVSMGSAYPIVNFTATLGVKGVLGSDFNYQKLELTMYDWFFVGSIGYSSVRLKGGKIFGTLPFLLLEEHPGNETFFFNTYAFNRMNDYEFISDTYASILYTHFFDGAILGRIPLIRKLKLRSLISTKMAFGSLSEENIRVNQDPNGEFVSFASEHAEYELPDWQLQTPGWKTPYIEAGVGIENILRLFRIDAIWRLTYTDTPGKLGLRTGMQLKF